MVFQYHQFQYLYHHSPLLHRHLERRHHHLYLLCHRQGLSYWGLKDRPVQLWPHSPQYQHQLPPKAPMLVHQPQHRQHQLPRRGL